MNFYVRAFFIPFLFAGIFLEMDIIFREESLSMVVPLLEQMARALVRIPGSMWSPGVVEVCLWVIIDLVNGAPNHMTALQEAASFEGAWIILARLKARHPGISTMIVATSVPGDCQVPDFFE